VEDLTTILRDENGRVTAYEGLLIDIIETKELEEKVRLIQFSIDRAAEGITWIDTDGRIVYANDEECRRLGYTREELMKMTAFDIDPTLTPQSWQDQWDELRRKGTNRMESEHRGRDGEIFPTENIIEYIVYNKKEFSFAFSRDISEKKQAEAVQKRLQATVVNALEIGNLAPWEHDIVHDVFIFNDYFYKIYHTTAEQVGGCTMSSDDYIRQFIHPDDVSSVRESMQRIMEDIDSHSGHQIEHRILFPDGSTGHVAVRFFFVRDEAGRVIKAYGVNQDITGRKLLEQERLAALHYFESMDRVNHAIQRGANNLEQIMRDVLDVCLSVFDCDRAFLAYPCDPDASSWKVPMERTRPEFPGPHAAGEMVPMDADVVRIFRISLSVPYPVSFDPGSEYPPSKDFWEKHGFRSQMVMALRPKTGMPWQVGLHQCTSDRVWKPEEKDLFEKIAGRLSDSLSSLLMYRDLKQSEEFLDRIVDNIPNTIIVKEADELRFVRINRAAETLLGFSREDLLGKNSYDLLPRDQADLYAASDREVIDGKVLVDIIEETIRNRTGDPRIIHTKKIPIFDETGKPLHLLTISEDITELKKLQARLNQAQKMESLGAMSGGIAHDFNNILQPMLGYCEILKEDLPADSPQQQFVEGIYTSGLRAKDLINQILTFSRQADRQKIPIQLKLILKEGVKLARTIIPSNIEIRLEMNECPAVMADPTQLHQIIMNLLINAYHAMEGTGGEISIRLNETELGEYDLKGTPLQPGGYARLSVSDTGCGMPQAVLNRIFEPYFTTKPQGKGTGLGLAVVYGIIREHGGHITVYSEVGKGSTFNVFLPLSQTTSETLPAEQKEPHPLGDERILLVDDESTIAQIEQLLLERIGYHVTAVRNGAEALAIFRASPDSFDLVISDLSMPGMSGDQLARELIAIRPEIPIIICTGFSERIDPDEAKALGIKEFLMKPVPISELSRKVRKALNEAK